jgi:hypothetical protein
VGDRPVRRADLTGSPRWRTPLRVLAAAALLLAGGIVAVAVVLLHGQWWGLALGLAATAATLVAVPGAWWGRLPFALGWSGAVLWSSRSRPEGDFLVANDVRGYALLVIAVVVVFVGVVSVRRRPAGRFEDSGSVGSTS